MQFLIQTDSYLKRERWFINERFGINIIYLWKLNQCASVILDNAYIEDGCEDELSELLHSVEAMEQNTELDLDDKEIVIEYPAPWYLTNPIASANWTVPSIPKAVNENFKVFTQLSYVFEAAHEMSQLSDRQRWFSSDSDFYWEPNAFTPSTSQASDEHEKIAAVLKSKSWTSEKKLDKYMKDQFGMAIEDDHFFFYDPKLTTVR